jgi:hypothetical protein
MDNEPQYTFVRENGQMFHTDKETIALLQAAQRYDEREGRWDATSRSVSEFVFDHGLESGRISEGSVIAVEQHRQLVEAPTQTETIASDGETTTPAAARQLAQEEDIERATAHDMRQGDMGMRPEGVRMALGMEPEDAVQRGLVFVEGRLEGETLYRATPRLVRQTQAEAYAAAPAYQPYEEVKAHSQPTTPAHSVGEGSARAQPQQVQQAQSHDIGMSL